jgi:hypothetical protein
MTEWVCERTDRGSLEGAINDPTNILQLQTNYNTNTKGLGVDVVRMWCG